MVSVKIHASLAYEQWNI